MKFLNALFNVARAYLFYPVMVFVFIWLYVKNAHWIYGVCVIAVVLILDPIWRIMASSVLKKISARRTPK